MSERDEKSGGGCAIGCVLVFLIAVLYVLSIGPVAGLVKWNPSVSWVGIIYAPLTVPASYCEPVGNALMWYIELCGG